METFLCLTGLQWAGLGVIATFLVSIIALFWPLITEWHTNNVIIQLVQEELNDNLRKIKQAQQAIDTVLKNPKGNQHLSALSQQIAISSHVSLKNWNEFKHKIAIKRPTSYQKFQKINGKIEKMTDELRNISPPTHPAISQALFLNYLKELFEENK